jgi:hypothetical protein
MLVGFCILNKEKTPDHGQFFSNDVKVITKTIGSSIVYLYGFGPEYEAPIELKTYSLYQDGLTHRNIHLRIASDHVEIKSDWLGSFPCYYDEVNREIASHWGMLNLQSRESDPIGSYILKRYSFIPTSRTLKEGVRRMLCNQTLVWRIHALECRTTDIKLNLKNTMQCSDVVRRIAARLSKDGLEKSDAIIPLSGGYDSRFLATIVKGEFGQTFRSFTYSLLGPSGDCFESRVSKVVAQKLGAPWRSFDLSGYASYERTIIDWTGGFTHVNGDYYEMFADQVLQIISHEQKDKSLVVSGIVGDAWCGKTLITYKQDLEAKKILLNHGIRVYGWLLNPAEVDLSKKVEKELNDFFSERIESNETILLELVRAKVALLSFLCYSFEKRGIRCSAPFLDKTVVEGVLSLDPKQRLERNWQKVYFKNLGLSDEQLPSVMFKINRLAIDEGIKKRCNSFQNLKLSASKIIFLKLLLSRPIRQIERALTRHKITEYMLRKIGYKRSDVLISILNVLTR